MTEVRWRFNPDRIAEQYEYRCVDCDATTVLGKAGGDLSECCERPTGDLHVTALLDTEPVREYMGTMRELAGHDASRTL